MDATRLIELENRVEAENAVLRAAFGALASDLTQALRNASEQLDRNEANVRKLRLMIGALNSETVPASLRGKIIRRDAMTCQYCGRRSNETVGPDGEPWHIDHVIPLAHGGLTHTGNLTLACAACNEQKQDRSACEYIRFVAQRERQIQVVTDVTPPTLPPAESRPTPAARSTATPTASP